MNKLISVLVIGLLLNGCAVSRGLMTGAGGGIAIVDEAVNYEAKAGTYHTEAKRLGHIGFSIASTVLFLPLGITYIGASAGYGAYKFWKQGKITKQ